MSPLNALFAVLLSFSLSAHAAKRRVLILYSTGGHSTAAKSIEQLLNQHPGEFEVIRKDFAEQLTGFARWFYFSGYDKISRHANWINRLGVSLKWTQAEISPVYLSQRFNADFNQPARILEYVKETAPDVIITTHFSVAETLGALRESGELKSIPIAWTHLDVVDNTFFKQIGDQLDMSFLPTEEMAREWQKVIPAHKLAASGIPIMPEMLGAANRPRPSSATPTVLMIGGSMGALSYVDVMREISRAASDAEAGTIAFVAVCGRNAQMRDKLEGWARSASFPKNASLTTTGFIDAATMRTLQTQANLIISKPGGLTTFELMTSERPVIFTEGIGIQEYFNARYIHDQGGAIFQPKVRGIGVKALALLADPDAAARQVANQARIRQNFRLERIVQWTRTARVTQPVKPAVTVHARLAEARAVSTPVPATALRVCAQLLMPMGQTSPAVQTVKSN